MFLPWAAGKGSVSCIVPAVGILLLLMEVKGIWVKGINLFLT